MGSASTVLKERFDIKSENIIITDRQYKEHIAAGANKHDDIFDRIREYIPEIIENPDYIFQDDKREDTVIYVSKNYQAQIVVKLNTKDKELSNTMITVFGCSEKRIRQNLRNKSEKLLYKKEKWCYTINVRDNKVEDFVVSTRLKGRKEKWEWLRPLLSLKIKKARNNPRFFYTLKFNNQK